MIFDTHANVLNHIVRKRLEEKSGIVDAYHIPEQLEGNVTGGIWMYFTDSSQALQDDFDQTISYILEELKQSENIQFVMSKDDWDDQSLNIVLGLQGLSMIKDIQHLEKVYQMGFRHASLTMEIDEKNHFVSDIESLKSAGLTDLGYELIKKMNELGMVIDVSKANKEIIADIQKVTTNPIIATCSNCYALTPHGSNLTDEQIKIIAEADGFIGVNAMAKSLTKPTVEAFVDHIDYLKQLVGIRHISLGFNFMNYLTSDSLHLDECQNVTQVGSIIDELFKRNYSSSEVDAIASINAKRVINKVLKD